MVKIIHKKWPISPYKGLSFYETEDQPLFAGREDDIYKCSVFLGSQSASILLLHGISGCGKSSFLRAGLIPKMEDNSFEFLKDNKNIIRSGGDPLLKLLSSIYSYVEEKAKNDAKFKTRCNSLNYKTLLSTSIEEMENREELITILLNYLKELDAALTNPLIITIDQAEEVITLNEDSDNIIKQKSFFDFIAKFSTSQLNIIKIIIILRTEYYGRFSNLIRREYLNRLSIGDYFLHELNDKELLNAIERPTQNKNFPHFGNPYKKYRFKYNEKLPLIIITDLKLAKLPGSILPVLQIVCKRLYEKTKKNKGIYWIIKYKDYKPFRNHENQIISYIEETISNLTKNASYKKENNYETFKWIKLLSILSRENVDGTLTSDILSEDELENYAYEYRIRTSIHKVINQLCRDDIKILREFSVRDKVSGNVKVKYSLSHDSIAYALKKWKDVIDKNITIAQESSSPFMEASLYNKNDLYGSSKIPQTNLYTINDHIWDHQIFLFAEKKGFLGRLGFNVKTKNLSKYSKYPDIQKILGRNENEIVIIPYPRVLIGPKYNLVSTELIITNVYTGYALIGRTGESIKQFDWKEPISSFNNLLKYLHNKKIMTEDEGAFNFAKSLEDISNYFNKKELYFNVIRYKGQDGNLFSHFMKEAKIDFVVGTAPLRAISREFGYPTFFDSNDVKRLINKYINRDSIFKNVISKNFIHNCWNINIPINRWKEYESTILRLASIGLFTIDYILKSQDDIADFIQKQLKEFKIYRKYELEKRNLIDLFYMCYYFSDSKNYYDNYLDSESYFHYESSLKYYSNKNNNEKLIGNCREIYNELIKYKDHYVSLADRYNFLQKLRINRKGSLSKAKIFRQRARKHFQIYNYYDAVKLMHKAIAILGKS